MTGEPTDLIVDFLKSHRLGVLATGRRDGSPQQALVAFNFDGRDIALNTSDQSAKAKNARRRPRVSLTVVDGRQAVVVYGTARIVRGEEAQPYRERLTPPRPAGETPAPQRQRSADAGEQIIIVLTPERYFGSRLQSS
jgi:PPOX class probable F420-dependent enzyme